MTTDELYHELKYVNHSRVNRTKYADLVLSNPLLIPELLEILFMVDDNMSCRAAWVLESLCGKNPEVFVSHLDKFTEELYKIHLDPAVRPAAKICEYLILAYYSKQSTLVQKVLTAKHKERIVSTCFDWLINDGKIAPKAYA